MSTVIFTLKDFLNESKQIQNASGLKSTAPTMEELAAVCKMQITPFSRMINNRTDSINKEKLASIIAELRRRGFDPTFDQLFAYYD